MDTSVVLEKLAALGLGTYEAQVYLVVVRMGEASAGLILEEVKLYREQVYRALKRLVDAGLVTHYIKHKRGYYAAVNPAVLVNRVKADLEIAESVQPYLESLQVSKPQSIYIRQGEEALDNLFFDLLATLKKGEEYLLIESCAGNFSGETEKIFKKYREKLVKKGVRSRVIINDHSHEGSNDLVTQWPSTASIRSVPPAHGQPFSTVMYEKKAVLVVLDSLQSSVITIENQNLVETYRENFELLWEVGRDIVRITREVVELEVSQKSRILQAGDLHARH